MKKPWTKGDEGGTPRTKAHAVTMQDVANATGLSRMSISLALRNSPRISSDTKSLVMKTVQELGYRPNPMVTALMTQLRRSKVGESSSTLAFLTTYPTRDGWKQAGPGWVFYLGAKAHAEALGFDLEIIWAKEPGMSGKRLSAILHTRNIRGVIVAPMARQCGHLTLKWDLFSSVILGYSSYRPNLHRAVSNTFQGTRLALRKLWQLGYRRIGLVIPSYVDTRTNEVMSAAYLRFQHDLKRAYQVPLPAFPSSRKPIDPYFLDWFRKHRPDAILSIVPEVKLWLEKEEGLRPPRDYGLALLSVSENPGNQRGVYAGLDQRDEQVGAAAVEIVSKQIFHGETGIPSVPQTVLIEGVWVDGPTVQLKS